VALFVVIVWAWIIYTLYANRFGTDDLIFRLARSGAMLAVAAIAVDVHRVMTAHGGTVAFAAEYVVLRLILIALYGRARRHVPQTRAVSGLYMTGYSFTTLFWFASIFVSSPARYLLWCVAMLIDLLIPTRAWRMIAGRSVVTSHLFDRFGTFFIIVLGESVVAAVAGVAGLQFTPDSWIAGGLCFLTALCLWWIYFDLADTSVLGRRALGLVFVYSHFALLAGVTAFGEGASSAIAHAAQASLGAGTRWTMAGGIGAFALSLAAIHVGAEWTSLLDRTFLSRVLLAAFVIALAAAGGGLPPLVFAGAIAAAVLGQLLLEAVTPRGGAASVLEPVEPPPCPTTPLKPDGSQDGSGDSSPRLRARSSMPWW
jgi:low temperature requirement protein LtrA